MSSQFRHTNDLIPGTVVIGFYWNFIQIFHLCRTRQGISQPYTRSWKQSMTNQSRRQNPWRSELRSLSLSYETRGITLSCWSSDSWSWSRGRAGRGVRTWSGNWRRRRLSLRVRMTGCPQEPRTAAAQATSPRWMTCLRRKQISGSVIN